MNKSFYSIGLMSGTSGDGVDASLVVSDGVDKFDVIYNEYIEYSKEDFKDFHELKEKIINFEDIKKYSKELKNLEKKLTICNSIAVEKIKRKLLKQNNPKVDGTLVEQKQHKNLKVVGKKKVKNKTKNREY